MNLFESQRTPCQVCRKGRLPASLFLVMLMSIMAIADGPIASSSFVGVEDPLSENGAWAPLTSLAPAGTRFQKNNGAYPDQLFRRTMRVPAPQRSSRPITTLKSSSATSEISSIT